MKGLCTVLLLLGLAVLVSAEDAEDFRAKVGGYAKYGPGKPGYTGPGRKKKACANAVDLSSSPTLMNMVGKYEIKFSGCHGKCPMNQFECASGGCICWDNTCDNVDHCGVMDGSDEFCVGYPNPKHVSLPDPVPDCSPAVWNADYTLIVTVANANGDISATELSDTLGNTVSKTVDLAAGEAALGSLFLHDYGTGDLKAEIYAHNHPAWDLEAYTMQTVASHGAFVGKLFTGVDNGKMSYFWKNGGNKKLKCDDDVIITRLP